MEQSMHPITSYIRQALQGIYPESEIKALAKYLYTEVFRLNLLDLYMGKDTNLSANQVQELEDILQRLKRNEPIQYITGQAEFCGLRLHVAPGVLIPRPETEELVDWMVQDSGNFPLQVLDIGTGSGCIALALAVLLPFSSRIFAWDVSEQALEIARDNGKCLGLEVSFEQKDILEYKPENDPVWDVIVSNPPYIIEEEKADMERNVLDWEPAAALFVSDKDPLLFYRRIARTGQHLLRPGGKLYFEINRAFGNEVCRLLQEEGYHAIELRKDLSGNDRMVKAVK